MNLNDLWSGNDYAYYEYKGRGEVYRPGAKPVKVIRTYKKQQYGNTKASGYAEVMMLNEDGSPKLNNAGEQMVRSVRARDIAMRWDEYVEEREHRRIEAERHAQENKKREEERVLKEAKLRELLTTKYGLPDSAINSIDHFTITLNRRKLEQELGLVE